MNAATISQQPNVRTRRPAGMVSLALASVTLAAAAFATPLKAVADDLVRVSIKHIVDAQGKRSPGRFTTDGDIDAAIAVANDALERSEATWRLSITEIADVDGASQFFNLDGESGMLALENAAKKDSEKYSYRDDAVNIFVVNSLPPGIGGICSFPLDSPNRPEEIIVINNQGINAGGVGWLHEVGHYLSLTHTFERPDYSPNPTHECTGLAAVHQRPDGRERQVYCPDNCPDTTNVMSYHRLAQNQAVFSPCQLGEMDYELAGRRSNVVEGSRPPSSSGFVRGDTDGDGAVALSDAIRTLSYLVDGGEAPGCLDATDADDNGRVDLTDVLYTLRALDGSETIPAPGLSCGVDPTADELDCADGGACGSGEDDDPDPVADEVTLLATADSVFGYDSEDPTFAGRTFAEGILAVGANWGFSDWGWATLRRFYTALKFELPAELRGKRIARAVLRLSPSQVAQDTGTEYAANAFAGEWDASSISLWTTPQYFVGGESRQQPPVSTAAPLEFDVTEIVRNWTDGTWVNNGFLLRDLADRHPGVVASRATGFESMDVHTASTRRPQLVITTE